MGMLAILRPATDWGELVFENRNRAYGAYVLRKSYDQNVKKAYSMLVGTLLLLAAGSRLSAGNDQMPVTPETPVDSVMIEVNLGEKQEEKQQQTETAQRQPTKGTSTDKPTHIVPDDKVKSEDRDTTAQTGDTGPTSDPGPANPDPGTGKGTDDRPAAPDDGSDIDHAALTAHVMAEFPGGHQAMERFISENLHFGSEAASHFDNVRILVSFTIDPEGKIVRVEPLTHHGYGLEEAVVDMIHQMPRWSPARQATKAVYVKMVLPVLYQVH